MKAVLNSDGGLETRVVTYFPTRTAVLITRLEEDQIEIQLGVVDQAGRFAAIRQSASQTDQAGGQRVDGADREPVRRQHFQGVIMPQRRLGFLQHAAQILRRLTGLSAGKGSESGGKHDGTLSKSTSQSTAKLLSILAVFFCLTLHGAPPTSAQFDRAITRTEAAELRVIFARWVVRFQAPPLPAGYLMRVIGTSRPSDMLYFFKAGQARLDAPSSRRVREITEAVDGRVGRTP